MKKIIFLLGLLPCCFTHAQSTNDVGNTILEKNEQVIWNNIIELHNAVFGNKDSIVMGKLVSSIVEYGHSNGNIEDKYFMVHNAAVNKTKYEEVSNQLISIKTIGKIGLVRLFLKATSNDNGVAIPLHLSILQVWRRDGDYWRLIERQAVKIPAK